MSPRARRLGDTGLDSEGDEEELFRLAEKHNLVRQVVELGEPYRRRLLDRSPPANVLAQISQIQRSLQELQECESLVRLDFLRQVLRYNWVHMLGEDKDGRVVVWEQGCALGKFLKDAVGAREDKLHAWILAWLWIVLSACRRRKSSTAGVLYICDFRKLALLDRSLAEIQLFTAQVANMFPLPPSNDRIILFASPAGRIFVKMFFSFLPAAYRRLIRVPSSVDEVLDTLADDKRYPTWFHETGDEVHLTYETHGNYEDLLVRQGFKQLTIESIYNPGRIGSPDHHEVTTRESEFYELCSECKKPCERRAATPDQLICSPSNTVRTAAKVISAHTGWNDVLKKKSVDTLGAYRSDRRKWNVSSSAPSVINAQCSRSESYDLCSISEN